MQLAACGVAAMCNTEESRAKQMISRDNPAWSCSYQDALNAVEREMGLRALARDMRSALEEQLTLSGHQTPLACQGRCKAHIALAKADALGIGGEE
jgi:hypothetical protein